MCPHKLTPHESAKNDSHRQSRIRRHVCVLFITKCILMGPYSGANGAGRPKNGASRLRSYLGKESVSMYDPHIA